MCTGFFYVKHYFLQISVLLYIELSATIYRVKRYFLQVQDHHGKVLPHQILPPI